MTSQSSAGPAPRTGGVDSQGRRQRRAPAVAAALAAGGLSSLAVVLLGPPSTPGDPTAQVVSAQSVAETGTTWRRADITLGEPS